MAERKTMRKTKPSFGIGVVSAARLDGTGEVLECPIVPASIVINNIMRAKSEVARATPGFFQAYVSLAITGELERAGIPVPDTTSAKSLDDGAIAFFSEWVTDLELPDGDGGEEGPTTAS